MSDSLLPGEITTLDITAQTIVMGSKSVTGITDDPTSNSPENLITGAALQAAVTSLMSAIQTNVQNVLTGIDGQVVITQNLVNPTFATITTDPVLGWINSGWTIANNTATITNSSGNFNTSNSLSVPPGRYPNYGYYFLTLTATTVSGILSVVLNNVALTTTITSAGTYNFLINVPNAITTTLALVASGVNTGESVVLSNATLTGINPVLYNLINYLPQELQATDETSAITNAVNAALTTAEDYTNTSVQAAIAAHLAAANPHPQYALLADLSNSTIIPDVIVYSQDAYVPPQIPGAGRLRSATAILTNTLAHISASAYCSQSGYLSATALTTTSLINCIINSGTSPTQPMTLFVLNPTALPTITYTFSKSRVVSQVIIYTETTSSSASVTQAFVTVDTATEIATISVTSENNITSNTITFSDIQSNNVVIEILDVSNNSLSTISFGFSVIFADVVGQDIAISSGTELSFNYEGQIKSLTINANTPVNVSSLIQGHEYTLSTTINDGFTIVPEILSIAPNWGDGSSTYKFPLNELTSDNDPYYGTTLLTGVPSGTNYYEIYTTDGAIVANSNVIVLTQTLATYITIDHINLKFPTSLNSGFNYPTNITFNLIKSTGATATLSITPAYQFDGISTETIISQSLLNEGPLSEFSITLTTATGTNCVLNKVDVAIPCLAYDTTEHVWSDNNTRKIIGSFTKLTNGAYQIMSQPVGTECVVPVNDLLQTVLYTVYSVLNPFGTKNIQVTPLSANTGLPTNAITIQTVTDSSLSVLATTPGVYLLDISRMS